MGERGEDKAAIEAALARLGPQGFCKAFGVPFDPEGGCFILCPLHGERTPSMNLTIGERRTLRGKCFGCGEACDAFTIVASVLGLSVRADFRRVMIECCRPTGLWELEAELCDREGVDRAVERKPVKLGPLPEPTPEKPYPDPAAVAALWAAARPLVSYRLVDEVTCLYETEYADREAYDELDGRALVPELLVDADACRVILPGDQLPRWARFRGARHESRPWPEIGYRLIWPVFDARGVMHGVRAWRVGPAELEGDEKRVPPTWCRADGLVLACPQMRRILETGRLEGAPFVIVCEGESDFASTLAQQWSDAAEATVGVLGLYSGAWTDGIAARIPDGTIVKVAPDADRAGDNYARLVNASIGARCRVVRL